MVRTVVGLLSVGAVAVVALAVRFSRPVSLLPSDAVPRPPCRCSGVSSGEEVMRSAQVALLSLLRSWPGLLLLCSQHAVAFRALIDSLHVDRPELRVSHGEGEGAAGTVTWGGTFPAAPVWYLTVILLMLLHGYSFAVYSKCSRNRSQSLFYLY